MRATVCSTSSSQSRKVLAMLTSLPIRCSRGPTVTRTAVLTSASNHHHGPNFAVDPTCLRLHNRVTQCEHTAKNQIPTFSSPFAHTVANLRSHTSTLQLFWSSTSSKRMSTHRTDQHIGCAPMVSTSGRRPSDFQQSDIEQCFLVECPSMCR